MRTREERRQRAREVRWMIGVGAMLCLTFWGGMAFAFGSWGDEMENIEHPDITAAMRTGYPEYVNSENQDSPENREQFINERPDLLIRWLRLGYPDILEEYIEMNGPDYREWLN